MNAEHHNADPGEIDKFDRLAADWWDPDGECAPLHAINPLRLGWIERQAGGLRGRAVVDIGCGGGILSESMAQRGARVTGIDLAADAIEAARGHAAQAGVEVDYRVAAAEDLAATLAGGFDVVTCMELLEHVPDPAAIVAACARLARPGGTVVFATINRTPKAWVQAIVGAEYLLGLLPRGTHEYARLVRPSELARWARAAGLDVTDSSGLTYNPLTRRYRLTGDIDVNYMLACHAPRGDDDE
ncbi:MAG: bifunctional 2-polyprenyl-6-hydroxyphenol methylase/3-demethylubiquinol 3-O-methyltransferase UbiG [Halofilum sp. (in: g-proteobacteria)]|nr:bifunctional 2-polyprenyl-6-hydroxyphenol methylase/3-demethylubiquinol 3-O-methyltransferase UbiG [Halofilum sp. (in: g-proteobacteria)]